MPKVTRRSMLTSAVAGTMMMESVGTHPFYGDDGNSLSCSMGKAARTQNGFDGVRLQVIAADDFTPVSAVVVSLTSRFCRTTFHTPEHMLTIQEDGRYLPQVFRVMFKVDNTTWAEMTGIGRRGDCEQLPR